MGHISLRLFRHAMVALLLSIAAISFPCRAPAQTFKTVGDSGDHQSPDKCQGSDYLNGFNVRSGDWLDAIGIICVPLNADGKTGEAWSGSLRGGAGGSAPRPIVCGADMIVVGAQIDLINDNKRIRRISFRCMNVQSHDQTTMVLGGVGETNVPQMCDSGNAITQVNINWGTAVNGVGMVCSPIKKGGAAQTNTTTPNVPCCLPKASGAMQPGVLVRLHDCPTDGLAPSNTAQPPADSKEAEFAILCLINAERVARGLSPLTVNATLAAETIAEAQAAVSKKWWKCAKDNPGCSHINPNTGTDPQARVNNSGYCSGAATDVGEITYDGSGVGNYYDDSGNQTQFACLHGCGAPAAAVDWWMNISPPHRANILSAAHKEVGIAAMGDIGEAGGGPDKGLYVVDFAACH